MNILLESFQQLGDSLKTASEAMSYVWFIVLPPLFYFLFKLIWMKHIQDKFAAMPDWVVLEIIPPKNIEKSPKPMEALYNGFCGVQKSLNPVEIYIDGAFTDYMSLEIVGDSGSVHFYIRVMQKYRHLVEAHLYAQYPDVEIIEVPDYVNDVPKIIPNSQWDLWGSDLGFTKNNAYPIKTYPKFEESITGKMIDPLSGLIETMGKLGLNQKLWLQWIIQPTDTSWSSKEGKPTLDKLKGRETERKSIFEEIWKDIFEILSSIPKAFSNPVEFAESAKKEEKEPLEFRLSPVEKDVLKAVEDNLGKPQFYVRPRYLYIGRRENYDKAVGINSFFGAIRQFSDDNLNSLKPNTTKTTAYHIFIETRLRYLQRKLLRRYRGRSMDGEGGKLVMSTEELATVFHLPDMNVLAPSLARVESKHGGAPSNLPVE
ncbi:MAG TPA: hypothetical protein P5548_02680 [Candidatus Moranbacteria bacterium]|nr:hypothetical protein [Candidatus Moranbacteria bacterium]HRZ33773.1 hypothetical protein [Candidatus Moranbacteria bacterium]